MSTARDCYERMGCLFSFAQTAFRRSATSVRPIAAKASGSHSESRGVADAEANFDDPTTTFSLSQVASQGQ
jgi:hypothetical protein